MTTDELKEYYANLLILQYIGKPKAYATIEALVELPIMDQIILDVVNGFELDTAVGDQLDILGQYIGVTRYQYDFSGPVTLDDTDYLTLLKIKIIQNNYTSDLSRIQDFLLENFAGIIEVFDYKDMTMNYVFQATVGSEQLAEVFVKGGFLPKPMGVNLRTTIYSPTAYYYFGFRTYDYDGYHVSPYNTYDTYTANTPYLTYDNGISV